MNPWERFADKLQASARGAAALGMAREALHGLDAMAANDPFVNSAQDTRGGERTYGSSRISSEAASGGGRSRPLHRSRDRKDHSPPPASKVRFRESEHQQHDDDADDADADVQRHQPLEEEVQEARDQSAAVTMADSATSSRRIIALRSKGRGEGNEFVGGQGPRSPALSRNGGDGAGTDGNDNDVTLPTTATTKEKSRQRFLDDLDEHISRPMKPMNIETSSNHTSSSNNGYEASAATAAGSAKWPTWLPLSASPAILFGTSHADGSAGRSPPPPPAPLLARASRTTKTDRANRSHDDPHQDEYRVHSSAAMLGDEERAQLKALMGITAGDATSITAGDEAVRASATTSSPAVWRQRREAFVGATLLLLLLVYYWARDRVVPDD